MSPPDRPECTPEVSTELVGEHPTWWNGIVDDFLFQVDNEQGDANDLLTLSSGDAANKRSHETAFPEVKEEAGETADQESNGEAAESESRPGKAGKRGDAVRNKASREKLRRERLNDRFAELASLLDPALPAKADKRTILDAATKYVKQIKQENSRLRGNEHMLQQTNTELHVKINLLQQQQQQQAQQQQMQAYSLQPMQQMQPMQPMHQQPMQPMQPMQQMQPMQPMQQMQMQPMQQMVPMQPAPQQTQQQMRPAMAPAMQPMQQPAQDQDQLKTDSMNVKQGAHVVPGVPLQPSWFLPPSTLDISQDQALHPPVA